MLAIVTPGSHKRAYCRREEREAFGASLSAVGKAILDGHIRVKRETRS